jgi:diguanylate cyclase (GGDEF)-like protein
MTGMSQLSFFSRHHSTSDTSTVLACRFGREEFVLILTDENLDAAQKRANTLRDELSELTVMHAGNPLGKITISIGISSFPDPLAI